MEERVEYENEFKKFCDVEREFLESYRDLFSHQEKGTKRSSTYRKNLGTFLGEMKGETVHHIYGNRDSGEVW